MKAATLILALLICCLPYCACAGEPQNLNNFLYFAPIRGSVQKGALYRVPLSGDIIGKCNQYCTDARILDQDRKEIPFVIIESRGNNAGVETYLFEITGYDNTLKAETVTMRLPEKHRAISAIQISTRDRDFRKKVQVYGSPNMNEWVLLAEDGIWDFSSQVDLRKTDIKFPESDYRYYRLIIRTLKRQEIKSETMRLKYHGLDFSVENERAGIIRIDRIEGRASLSRLKSVHDENMFAHFSSRKDEDRTMIDIEAGIPFERISFEIANSYYFRKVGIYHSDTGKEGSFRLVTMEQVYSFPFSDSKETRNYIECPGSGKGYYRFVIENRNNPPLEIKNIKLAWVRRNAYFIALDDSSQYTLWFGNSSLKRPEYDIVHFINQSNWHTHSAKELQLGQVERNTAFGSAPNKDRGAAIEKVVLTLIVVLLVIVIAYWLYSLVRNADLRKEE